MRYSIDINENAVQVIKFNNKGIKSVGSADFETTATPDSDQYADDLTAALKKAAKEASIPKGFGIPATVVAGGPEVVMRRFTWPQMPASALKQNATSELAPLLPGDSSDFSISHEILRTYTNEDTGLITDDVLVAALPLDFIEAVKLAAKRTGFKCERIDVRENSRIRLVNEVYEVGEEDPPESYAVLDFSQKRANMGLYLNGAFYSNRYFSASPGMAPPVEEPMPMYSETTLGEDGQPLPPPELPTPPKKSPLRLNYDPNTLANDVVSIIDYMQYRERGSNISCILLIGEENLPGIVESLEESLDIPIYPAAKWIYPELSKGIKSKGQAPALSSYLDAYGAGIQTKSIKESLNLKGIIRPSKMKTVVLPIVSIATTLIVAIGGGIYILNDQYRGLQRELISLQNTAILNPAGEGTYADLRAQADSIHAQLAGLEQLRTQWPDARDTLPLFFDASINGQLAIPVFISSVTLQNGSGFLSGLAVNLGHVADIVDALNIHPLVESVGIPTQVHVPDPTYTGAFRNEIQFTIPISVTLPPVVEESEGDY